MRVATYSDPNAAAKGSAFAVLMLVLIVALGSSALHSLMNHFVPQLHTSIALLWLLTYVAAFFGLMFSHGINWISWLARYRLLLVVVLFGTAISVSWSLDAAVSAERVVHLLGSSIIAIYLGFMVPLLTTLRISAVVLGVIMVASIAAAYIMPELGLQEYEGQIVWSGILNSKNALGFWAAIAVLLYVTLSESSNTFLLKVLCYLMAVVSLFVLIKSESATSLLAMLVAGSLSLYIYIAIRFQLGFVRMVVLALLMAGLVGFVLSNISTAELVGRTGDLTGRGEVWRQTWKLIMEKPVTGYGYGSIWFPNDATLWIQQSLTDFTWVVYHAHNGFLQVASEIGLPLSCIALIMVAQQLIEIFYCQYERQQVGVLFVLAFVVAYLISNFSEARFLVNRELYWIFFLALPISMLRQINVVSVDELEPDNTDKPWGAAKGRAWGHHQTVPGKPWLNPKPQNNNPALSANAAKRAALAAGAGIGAVAAGSEQLQLGVDESDLNASLDSATDFAMNDDIDDFDLSDFDDATLDNTQSAVFDESLAQNDTAQEELQNDPIDRAPEATEITEAEEAVEAAQDTRNNVDEDHNDFTLDNTAHVDELLHDDRVIEVDDHYDAFDVEEEPLDGDRFDKTMLPETPLHDVASLDIPLDDLNDSGDHADVENFTDTHDFTDSGDFTDAGDLTDNNSFSDIEDLTDADDTENLDDTNQTSDSADPPRS